MYSNQQMLKALKVSNGDVANAMDLLLNQGDAIMNEPKPMSKTTSNLP